MYTLAVFELMLFASGALELPASSPLSERIAIDSSAKLVDFASEGFTIDCDDGSVGTMLCLGTNVFSRLDNNVDLVAYALANVAFNVAVEAINTGDKELEQAARQGLRNLAHLLQNPGASSPVARRHHMGFNPMMFALLDLRGVADIASDFTPGVSAIKDLVIVATGVNPLTHEEVTNLEKSLRIGFLVAPSFIGAASRKFVAISKALEKGQSTTRTGMATGRLLGIFHGAEEETVRVLGRHLSLPCTP